MMKIDLVEWGRITIAGKEYNQVLIIGGGVIERDSVTLHQLFGTTHKVSNFEVEKLLEGRPEIIIIGNGWDGVMEVGSRLKVQSAKLGIDLKALRTPEAVEEYNRLVEEGKRVNALIHTTC